MVIDNIQQLAVLEDHDVFLQSNTSG